MNMMAIFEFKVILDEEEEEEEEDKAQWDVAI